MRRRWAWALSLLVADGEPSLTPTSEELGELDPDAAGRKGTRHARGAAEGVGPGDPDHEVIGSGPVEADPVAGDGLAVGARKPRRVVDRGRAGVDETDQLQAAGDGRRRRGQEQPHLERRHITIVAVDQAFRI